jgi:hypothetical protein
MRTTESVSRRCGMTNIPKFRLHRTQQHNFRIARHSETIAPNSQQRSKGNSRFSRVVSIFPVIGIADITENEPDRFGKPASEQTSFERIKTNADWPRHRPWCWRSGRRVRPLVKTVALRAVEDGGAQAGVQISALLRWGQVRNERGNRLAVVMQHRPCDLGV